jgi:hypothetical protein
MSFINSETPLHLKIDFPKAVLCPGLALYIAYLTGMGPSTLLFACKIARLKKGM